MQRKILLNDRQADCGPLYRWGFLGIILSLILVTFGIYWTREPTDWFGMGFGLVVPLMLLLNHLASSFTWRRTVQVFLNILSTTWLIVGCIIVFSALLKT